MADDSERFRLMVEQSQDWFWEFDEQANFTYVSPRIRTLLGYEPEELLGLNAFDLMDEAEAERVRQFFDPIAEKHLPFTHLENVNRHKDGHEVVLESSGTPIFDRTGKFRGYRGIDRDITRRKKIERVLREKQKQLKQALEEAGRVEKALKEIDRIRNEFISSAAHELNTPVCAIMGYAELLLDRTMDDRFDDEQKREFLGEIYERGETLSRFIEDLLDISRIESGQHLVLDRQPTNLPAFLDQQAAYFGTRYLQHHFRLEIPDTPTQPELSFDRRRLRQVLDNLVSNAVKYSPPKTRIVLQGREIDGGWEIQVADQGIGMTEEQSARVFDKFYRADSSDSAISGLGLGMSIARQIIEAHDGSIRVDSTPGQGTTVSVFLPGGEQAITGSSKSNYPGKE